MGNNTPNTNTSSSNNKSMTTSISSSSSSTTSPASSSSRRNNKNSHLKNTKENREILNNQIMNDLKFIQLSLINLDNLIEIAINKLNNDFDILRKKITSNMENDDKYRKDVMEKHAELTTDLKMRLNISLSKSFDFLPNFFQSNKTFYDILIESFMYINNRSGTLFKKVKYLKFHNEFEILDVKNAIVPNCYQHIIIPINRNRIFVCLAIFNKLSFMKITDRFGNDLFARSIDKQFYYREFLVFGKHIAGLFDDSKSDMNIIQIYDDQLRLLSSKIFNYKFKLLYLTKDELVCMNRPVNYIVNQNNLNQQNQYFFFNLNLDQTFSFRVQPKQINDNIILLGANGIEIYLLNLNRKFLKIIDRKSGKTNGSIDFDSIDLIKSFATIKFDFLLSNFIFKSDSSRLKYYDHASNSLVESDHFEKLKCFNSFDLTMFNDVFTCDNLNKKIYFL
jgi:hypothetical protein